MENDIIRNPKISLTTTVTTIAASDYISNYRDSECFMECCKACRRYGKTYACPPFDFDADEFINGYETVFLIGTKIVFDETTKAASTTVEIRDEICHNATDKTIDDMAIVHNAMLDAFPDSISFLVSSCRLCLPKPCARLSGMPCVHPDNVRHSLESVGFDVGKTTSDLLDIDLQWSRDYRLADYLVIVTALFTNADKAEFQRVLLEKLDIADDK